MYAAGRHYSRYVIALKDNNTKKPNRHGHLEALESSHAIWEGVRLAKTLPKDSDIVIVSATL